MTTTNRLAPPSSASETLVTKGFLLLAAGELAYFVADGMTLYLVPVHATALGAGRTGAGLAFGAFALSALLLRPWVGRLCDSVGRRPLLVGGAVVALATCWLTAHVETLAALIALRLVAGVAEAAVFVAVFAAVADLAPASRMGEAISYNSLALYLGLAGGPPLAELLVRVGGGFATGWYGAAALGAVAAAAFGLLPETRPARPDGSGRTPLLLRQSVPVALGFLASAVAMGGFLAFAVLHADRVGLERTSLPLFVYGSVVVLGRVAFARVPDRVPSLLLGAAALGTMAAGLVLAAAWPTPAGLLSGTALMALGVTFSTPAFFSAIFATAGPAQRGAASATASMCLDVGLGLGPVALGVTADRLGIPGAFGAAAGIALLGAAWTLRLTRQTGSR